MGPVIYTAIPYSIDLQALECAVRINPQADPDLAAELREFAARAGQVATPKGVYRLVDVRHTPDGQRVAAIGEHRFTSKVMDTNLRPVNRAFAYVATCGVELATVDTGHDPLLEYWLSAICLQAVAHAMQYLKEQIQTRYQLEKTAAMNPGSLPDWPLSEQPKLFALIGDVAAAIGVTLSESFLMHPLKSVSGLLFETATHYENCMLCPRPGCPNRRAAYDAAAATCYTADPATP